MSDLPADCFVPVPLRWRHVQAGDVIVGTDGRLWHVIGITSSGRVHAAHGALAVPADVDPDEVARVLVPVAERDAMTMCRDDLGARITERRAGPDHSSTTDTPPEG